MFGTPQKPLTSPYQFVADIKQLTLLSPKWSQKVTFGRNHVSSNDSATESQGSPLWMTSPMTSAITQSIRKSIVLLFAIVLRECAECIAQGHVTGATPYCAIVTSLTGGSPLEK